MSRAAKLWLISVGLVLLCFAAYLPLWQNDFIDLDDEVYVTKNEQVRNGLSADGIVWAWTTWNGGFWIPMTWMSLQFDASLSSALDRGGESGVWAPAFHGQNLLWHMAACVLILIVLTRMTARVWPSALVAALFAVHPLHVESVAWATERKDVLSAFFWMLTVLGYLYYVEQPSWGRSVAVAIPFILGLLAKPMLVTLPFALLLLDFWPLRRWGTTLSNAPATPANDAGGEETPLQLPCVGLWRLVLEKAPLFVLAIGASVLTIFTQKYGEAINTLEHLPVASRLANAAVSYVWYLQKTFWPTDLAVFYVHPLNDWSWFPVLGCCGILLAITLLALAFVRRAPWILVGWLWFVGTLLPVIGLVQAGAQARGDRFVYIPHIGLFVALVWTAAALLKRFDVPAAVGWAASALCLMVLSAMTFIQVGYWENTQTIWEHAIAILPDNHRAHGCLQRWLFDRAIASGDRELLEQSVEHGEKSVALNPGNFDYEYNYAVALILRGKVPDLEKAADLLLKALQGVRNRPELKNKPTYGSAAHNLGLVQRRLKRFSDAVKTLSIAVDIPTNGPDTRAEYGMALWEAGRREEAQNQWQTALKANPKQAEALHGMGLVMLQQGKNLEAARLIQAALKSDPTLVSAYSDLGVAAGRLNEWKAAIQDHSDAKRLCRPYSDVALFTRRLAFALNAAHQTREAAEFYKEATAKGPHWRENNLKEAWELATSPNPTPGDAATAWELAAQACEADTPSAGDWDVEAAALAATGRFEDAVRAARQALDEAEPTEKAAIEKRLALYEMKKRFVREPKE